MSIENYFINNIPLFSISAVMLFLAFRNLRIRKRESIYFLIFTSIVLFLSVVVFFEKYSQAKGWPVVGTIFTSIGYVLRPALLCLFVLLANMEYKRPRSFYYYCHVPLLINLVVYLIPLFMGVPGLNKLVFYYEMNADALTASFKRGTFLNFVSHAVCLYYLAMLIYVSTVRFHSKHRRDGMVIIFCVVIVLTTVVVEMITTRNDLLNIVCEICAMVNFIFIMTVNASRDPLTNLYDRRTYYEDVSRYKDLINGIIQIDMNGLKELNDTFGHLEGDNALITIAKIFDDVIDSKTMCTYHISGDEFVILMFQGKIEQLDKTVEALKEKMENCKYSIAIGCCFIDKKQSNITYDEAFKKAEELMYADKSRYYTTGGRDRRKH